MAGNGSSGPGPDAAPAAVQDLPPVQNESRVARIRNHPWFTRVVTLLVIVAAIAGALYWLDLQSKVYVENSQITAPEISLNPSADGIIDEVDVSVGDEVKRDQILAKVGDETIKARTSGVITGVRNTPGQMVNLLTDTRPVIAMIDPHQLRVTGRVQEDKGLKDIQPGQSVVFTADAFPGREYEGTVLHIAPAAREGDIVFSISDKREEQEFEVTVGYDVTKYPELKDGMSAKMWIYK